MNGYLRQLGVQLRLHFRNRMALLYSYLFPTIFLIAFWVLYRHETVPLVRHMGELLTVTALGGACFGLPTALVSERERGVWRRFRLVPVRTASLVSTTLVARYLLLLTAGLLQLALAMGVFGMPAPRHPFELLVAFTLVSFAFLGLGLVIAALSDNVPAVQALGQCIFLPMLVIGGVAVRIETLPAWAQHVSAYFPGRYAVESIQVTVAGDGLGGSFYALFALLAIGGAAFLAGAKLFRWDQQQRFARLPGKGWVGAAVVGWLFVGGLAQATGQVSVGVPLGSGAVAVSTLFGGGPTEPGPGVDRQLTTEDGGSPSGDTEPAPSTVATPPGDAGPGDLALGATPDVEQADEDDAPATEVPGQGADSAAAGDYADRWRTVTMAQIQSVDFAALPLDKGVEAPIGYLEDPLLPEDISLLDCMRSLLPQWPLAQVDDPVERVRNVLYVPAVPDVLQVESLERTVPLVVFDYLREAVPPDELARILYWIAANEEPDEHYAANFVRGVCMDLPLPDDIGLLRERMTIYALKLLGRVTGAIQQQ